MDSIDQTSTRREVRSKSDYDLTNINDVQSYLQDHRGLRNFRIEALSGGTGNYVYRVIGQGVVAGKSRVLKHAAPQLASNAAFKLPQARMDFEARLLANKLKDGNECHCTSGGSENGRTHAHTVPLLFYEEDIKLLCIQDAGAQNLKDAYMTLGSDQVQEIGTEIGKWLADFHALTPASAVTGSSGSNNDVGVNIARYTYTNLATVLAQAGYNQELGSLIHDYFGELIKTDKESVCHGDFWPGNILLQSSSPTQGPWVVSVVDWELVRIGCTATDVGQFAAEAFLLDRLHGNKGLHAAFIQSYFTSSRRLTPHWLTRVAVHFATHLAFWPSQNVHWANGEDALELIDLAVTILEDAITDTPNVAKWVVFDPLPDLPSIANKVLEERGDPMPNPETLHAIQS